MWQLASVGRVFCSPGAGCPGWPVGSVRSVGCCRRLPLLPPADLLAAACCSLPVLCCCCPCGCGFITHMWCLVSLAVAVLLRAR
eukprot:1049568-Alexandrium_andersonii.AAC.1